MAAISALTPETSNASFDSNNTDDVYSLMNEAGIQVRIDYFFMSML